MNLNFQLNDLLKLTLKKVDELENDASNKKKRIDLIIQLWDSDSTKRAISKRVIRWPIGQSLPEEMTYLEDKEIVVLKGKTTKVEIPLLKSKIESLTAVCLSKKLATATTKTYASFAVNPVETSDFSKVISSVKNVSENPLKEKRWKKLIECLENVKNEKTTGLLSKIEQSLLVDNVTQFLNDPDTEKDLAENILRSLISSKLLTYRNEDILLRLCVEKEKEELIELVLFDSSRVLSEYILAQLLKLAIKGPENSKRKKIMDVLNRNFSKNNITETISQILSTNESVELMIELMEVYREFGTNNSNHVYKALLLITILMDSHGSRIVYEEDLHQKFAIISNFVIEMQALIGTFSKMNFSNFNGNEHDLTQCLVKRIPLVVHKLNW